MNRFRALLPALLYAGAIAYVSHLPGLPQPLGFAWGDKLLHALVYTGFGLTLTVALRAWFPHRSFRFLAIWTVLLGALYAASDEVHQLFVPYRVADPLDWAADVVGVVLSVFLFRWFRSRTGRLRRQ